MSARMSLKEEMTGIARAAKEAAGILLSAPTTVKNQALKAMAEGLRKNAVSIISANQRDVMRAKAVKLPALIDRLTLNKERIDKMAVGLEKVIALPNPVGKEIRTWRRPNGLRISKVRVPIGVIAIVYESRPDVTSDCAGLCLKAGNSVVLKGGREALYSNASIYRVFRQALRETGLPEAAVNLVETPNRKAVDVLLSLSKYIDLVIPRGGEGLIRLVARKSRIPVIKHYQGICHTYVDKDANFEMAESVCFNAKVQRPGVCNAMETLLVHREAAGEFLPRMLKKYRQAGVEIRGCPVTRKLDDGIKKATEKDWATEYLDLILSVKVVRDIDEAIAHITRYGSRHSDAIITENRRSAGRFLKEVDSACVYVNASTRFTDGGEFGMGAEIGISTDKLHARGPMALEELTSYKYIIFGHGQIRT